MKIVEDINMSFIDYPNPAEWCFSIYFVGCFFGCKGCHNKELQDKDYEGVMEIDVEELFEEVFETNSRMYKTNNICILGGEPLTPHNINDVKDIVKYNKVNNKGYNFCIYTGYELEYVKFNEVDGYEYIVTGLYEEEYKVTMQYPSHSEIYYKTLGSSNQKLFDKKDKLLSGGGIIYL